MNFHISIIASLLINQYTLLSASNTYSQSSHGLIKTLSQTRTKLTEVNAGKIKSRVKMLDFLPLLRKLVDPPRDFSNYLFDEITKFSLKLEDLGIDDFIESSTTLDEWASQS